MLGVSFGQAIGVASSDLGSRSRSLPLQAQSACADTAGFRAVLLSSTRFLGLAGAFSHKEDNCSDCEVTGLLRC